MHIYGLTCLCCGDSLAFSGDLEKLFTLLRETYGDPIEVLHHPTNTAYITGETVSSISLEDRFSNEFISKLFEEHPEGGVEYDFRNAQGNIEEVILTRMVVAAVIFGSAVPQGPSMN